MNEVDETVLADDSILDRSVAPASTESEGDISTRVKKPSYKKKKHSRGDNFEVVMNGVMTELVSAQNEMKSDI